MTEGRHSGMDCRGRQTAQRIQAPWRVRSSPSMALDTRFPAGMTVFLLI